MNKIYLGNDIEQISRFSRLLNKKPRIVRKMFFESEWKYAIAKANPSSTLTGIWCSKEAILKAFSPLKSISIVEIEITHSIQGFPIPILHSEGLRNFEFQVSLSISHSQDYAIATAIVNFEG